MNVLFMYVQWLFAGGQPIKLLQKIIYFCLNKSQ